MARFPGGVDELMGRTAKLARPMNESTVDGLTASVFSGARELQAPPIKLPRGLRCNKRLKMDGLKFLSRLPPASIPVSFFDPQYRGILDAMGYGNEGKRRGKARCDLKQMNTDTIGEFVRGINDALIPSGHLFLWMDKFHLCMGFSEWLTGTSLDIVDMLTWNKGRMGMGYRTRRLAEYLIVLQKEPRRAKGVWKIHNIPDVWHEEVTRNGYAHKKPVALQAELIAAVSNPGDIVIDPAAGSFSVMEACEQRKRNFLGCDING